MTKIAVNCTNKFNDFYTALKNDDLRRKQIDEAMDFMKSENTIGDKIERKLWPKDYVNKHCITNLFRYNIAGAHRLLYTITTTRSEKIYLILDCLPHNDYNKLFGYRKN